MKQLLIFSSLVVILAASCGKKTPLTGKQRDAVKDLTKSVAGLVSENRFPKLVETKNLKTLIQVPDKEAQKLSDVTLVEIDGVKEDRGSHANALFGGKIYSLRHGEVGFRIHLSTNRTEREESITYQFTNFAVEIKAIKTPAGNRFTFDNEMISEEEYESYRSGGVATLAHLDFTAE